MLFRTMHAEGGYILRTLGHFLFNERPPFAFFFLFHQNLLISLSVVTEISLNSNPKNKSPLELNSFDKIWVNTKSKVNKFPFCGISFTLSFLATSTLPGGAYFLHRGS